MNQTYLFEVYVVYSLVAVALTVWLARTLSQNGAVFLADVFKERPQMAEAVNRLLVVGFYIARRNNDSARFLGRAFSTS